jgi:hypothetical protein
MIAAGAALLVGVAAGYLLGQRSPAMHTTQARCVSAQGAISCQKVDDEGNVDRGDDWTYGVSLDVSWTSDGVSHEGDRPKCLPPTGRGLSDVVELTWADVEVAGSSWREVVSVGCK